MATYLLLGGGFGLSLLIAIWFFWDSAHISKKPLSEENVREEPLSHSRNMR